MMKPRSNGRFRRRALRPRMDGKSPFHPIRSYKATYDGSLTWIKRSFTWRMRSNIVRNAMLFHDRLSRWP